MQIKNDKEDIFDWIKEDTIAESLTFRFKSMKMDSHNQSNNALISLSY